MCKSRWRALAASHWKANRPYDQTKSKQARFPNDQNWARIEIFGGPKQGFLHFPWASTSGDRFNEIGATFTGGCRWETFHIFAYCGLVVEIQPLNCYKFENCCSPSNVNQVVPGSQTAHVIAELVESQGGRPGLSEFSPALGPVCMARCLERMSR